jgi:hypothetical protein
MAEVVLQTAGVDAIVGNLVAAGMAKHVRNLAATPSLTSSLRKPAVMKGDPRSETNANGLSRLSRLSFPSARSWTPDSGCTDLDCDKLAVSLRRPPVNWG